MGDTSLPFNPSLSASNLPLADLESIRSVALSDLELLPYGAESFHEPPMSGLALMDLEVSSPMPVLSDAGPCTKFCESLTHPGRLVEVGFIPNFKPLESAILFDGFPLWIIMLKSSFCK